MIEVKDEFPERMKPFRGVVKENVLFTVRHPKVSSIKYKYTVGKPFTRTRMLSIKN